MSHLPPALVLTLVALGPGAVAAGNVPAETAADAELLEFLGSIDSSGDAPSAADDGSWIDYLARTDINKVAKPGDPLRPPPPPSPSPASPSPSSPSPPPTPRPPLGG